MQTEERHFHNCFSYFSHLSRLLKSALSNNVKLNILVLYQYFISFNKEVCLFVLINVKYLIINLTLV